MLRAREAGMLTRERMDRMLSAPSFQEAAKLLTDCGYEDMSGCDAAGVDAALSRSSAEVFAELADMCPQGEVVDIFRAKYDYHNLKTLVKAKRDGRRCFGHILSGCGRVEAGETDGMHGRRRGPLLAPGGHGGGVYRRRGGPRAHRQPAAGRLRAGPALLCPHLRPGGEYGQQVPRGLCRRC